MARPKDDLISDYLPLTPAVFDVLLALADGDRHGYAIAKEVEARSGGRVRFGPGTLYGTLTRMLGAGFVRECDGPDDDDGPGADRRRYYRLTPLGREVARAEARRLAELVNVAHAKALLKGSAWSR